MSDSSLLERINRQDGGYLAVREVTGMGLFSFLRAGRRDRTAVSRADRVAQAEKYLRETVGIDLDSFLAHRATLTNVLDEPLGPTAECLSANEAGSFVERSELSLAKRKHVAGCGECRHSVQTYRRAAVDDWKTLVRKDLASAIQIYKASALRVPSGADFFLILTSQSEENLLQQLDASSISLGGAIKADGCRIDRLDGASFGAREAVALHFERCSVNVPRSEPDTPIADWLLLEGKARGGASLEKRTLVCLQVG